MNKKAYVGLKGMAGLGVCLLAMAAGGLQVHASYFIEEIELQQEQEAQGISAEEIGGYVDVPYTIHSIDEGGGGIEVLRENELPAAYDAREHGVITSVKRQNPWGNCWSFAAMSALESSLISDGYSPDIDLSEYHLNYYSFKSITDPLNGTEGDSFTYTGGDFGDFLNAGGNILVSYHALTNWVGAVEEDVTGYPTGEAVALEDTVESAYLNDTVHVQQMYQLNKEDRSAVKKEIMEHGSLTASFYYKASYYNSSTGGYYNNVNTSSNHAVAVVGWDDNFSKENFKTQPAADGAWLVKNSWGTSFGQEGYLWISYEDTSLGDAMCLLLGEDADTYDNNYQYDGSFYNMVLKGQKEVLISNIFRIQEGETREELKAVSFEVGNTNVDYSIQIYGDLQEEGKPLSGTPLLQESVVGTAVYQGYHTVELPTPMLLNPGETFAVVITLDRDDYVYLVAEKSYVWNNIEFKASAKENQSLLSTDGGAAWSDVGKKYGGNLRIKAFTCNTEQEPCYKVEDVTITPEALTLNVGESGQLQAKVSPNNADNQAVVWSSQDETIATVDENGLVTAQKAGKTTIICASEDGGASEAVQVRVRNVLTLEPTESELAVGESTRLKLWVNGVEEPFVPGENFPWDVAVKIGEPDMLQTEVDTDMWEKGAAQEMEADTPEESAAQEDTMITGSIIRITRDGAIIGTAMGCCTITLTNKEDAQEQVSADIHIRTPFTDIRTIDWQYPFVVNMYEKGFMVGKTAELFGTNECLSRSQFVTILYAISGKPECEYQDKFSDVQKSDWFALPVTWALENGITAGYADGRFGSSDTITREQMVLMLYRYGEMMDYDLSFEGGNLEQYPDAENVSSYAEQAMDWAVEKGMISGRGDFLAPSGETSRGECATIVTRFLQSYGIDTDEE